MSKKNRVAERLQNYFKFICLGLVATASASNCEAAFSGSWTYRDGFGRDHPLCHALLRRLNRYARDQRPDHSCSWDALASYPEFTELNWEYLDASKHEDLIFKLEKYLQEGPGGYFEASSGRMHHSDLDSQYYARKNDFLKNGGRIRVFRTRPALIHGTDITGKPKSIEEQVIVQTRSWPWPAESTECTGAVHSDWKALTAVILPDLSGPDPGADPGTFGLLSDGTLFEYEGHLILISDEMVWLVSEKHLLEAQCDFEYNQGKRKMP